MARINIEDALWKDHRFIQLCIKFGDSDKAVGSLIRAWVQAQEFWKNTQNGIPKSVWKDQNLKNELIEVGLADDRGDFIYMRGSQEQFAWLKQRIDAGHKGGIAGRTRSDKLPDPQRAIREGCRILLNKAVASGAIIKPDNCQNCGSTKFIEGHHKNYTKPYEVDWVCKVCHNEIHRGIQRATDKRGGADAKPSFSFSPSDSSSSSLSDSESYSKTKKKENLARDASASPRQPTPGSLVFEAWDDARSERWGERAARNGMLNKQASDLVKRIGAADAIEVVKFYVQHNDGFYVKQLHPLGLCLKDAESLHTQWKRGQAITSNDVRQFEKQDFFRAQAERFRKERENGSGK